MIRTFGRSRPSAGALLVLATLGAGAGAGASGCEGKNCSTIGCESGASFSYRLVSFPPDDSVFVDTCRNGVCASFEIASFERIDAATPARPVTRPLCPAPYGGGPTQPLDVTCSASRDASGVHLGLSFAGNKSDGSDKLVDGDTYTFRLTDAKSGARLLDLTKTATYKKVIDDPDCNQTCYQVDLSP